MTVVTCPDYECRHNSFGECHLGIVAQVIDQGVVSETHCPYYDPLQDPGGPEG